MMKLRLLIATCCVMACGLLQAANSKATVSQVTGQVTLTSSVDYIITDATPFSPTGSVNIENTDHAVLILQEVRPSAVIKENLLEHVFINGQQAVNNKNCQVRMYAQGSIIFPYGADLKPLTVYAEQNCQGESCNDFGLENSGGYMNTLRESRLNNRIRSFVLKRGYMVTFAVGTMGWGYSRCFIAHDEDLVVNTLPAILDSRISSYRVFQWYYAQKKGLASDGGWENNSKLGTSWCYDWAEGNASLLPDVEWVPNHIYEDWPSTSVIGKVTGSCHSKNNNEPGNKADDMPQDVATVLANWQNVMRTGLRLCSETSHDGSWWHLDQFLDSIDARGWRCDIVDFHCYWDGEWNSLDWYIDAHAKGRPVWISEWVWGASWNNNGIFNTDRSFSDWNQQRCYDGTKPILDRINGNDRVERYAYWNGEADCSKLIKDGKLSILGRYYAQMKSGIGYKPSREYIPKETRITPINNLALTYNRRSHVASFTWTEAYGDLITSITLQGRRPGTSSWANIASLVPRDQSSASGYNCSAADTLDVTLHGEYEYRVREVTYANKILYSNVVSVSIPSQQEEGPFIFGTGVVTSPIDLTSATTRNNTTVPIEFDERADVPMVFLGLPTNKNSNMGVTPYLTNVSKAQMKFSVMPWTEGFKEDTYGKSESLDYMVIPAGTYTYGDVQVVAGSESNVSNEWTEVTFPTPFPEGETPVVICQPYHTTQKYGSVARVADVTNRGFRLRHVSQSTQSTVSKKAVHYIAVSQGQATLGKYLLTAGLGTSPVGGSAVVTVSFKDADGEALHFCQPTILCGPQTDNLDQVASIFRISSAVTASVTDAAGEEYTATTGLKIRRQMDASYKGSFTNTASGNGDVMGWICLSVNRDAAGESSVLPPTTDQHRTVYTLGGTPLSGEPLTPGLYIINDGSHPRKVVVR